MKKNMKEVAKVGDQKVRMFITEGGTIFTEDDLKRYEIPASKQMDLASWQGLPIIEPPYDLTKLMSWSEISVPHCACLHTKVQDCVGIGWHLEQEDDNSNPVSKDEVEDFFNNVNEDEDIITVAKKVMFDFEGCGNGYIEVARDAKGKVSALYHIPAISVRVHKSKKLFIQRVGAKTIWFKKYGDERIIDNRNGEIADNKKIEPELLANEIIQLKQYTWRSAHYGLPDWLPALASMLGEMKEKDYNLNFFSSYGIPAYAVLLKGMDMTEEIEDTVKKYFETEIKGNPHRTMVFSVPSGGEIVFEPLSVQQKEASFRVYKRDNRDDVLTAHRVPPYRAGIVVQGQLAGGVASETDRIYQTSIIEPKQRAMEWVINTMIVAQGLEVNGWFFRFDDITIDNRLQQAQIDQIYLMTGVTNPNEIRLRNGDDPYEGGDAYTVGGAQAGSPTGGEETPATTDAGQGTDEVPASLQPLMGKRKNITVLGKGSSYRKFVLQKARRQSAQKQADEVFEDLNKSLVKEFSRQGSETQDFLQSENILTQIHSDAQNKYPELYTEKREDNFYEEVVKASKDDYEKVEKMLIGWSKKIKPEKMEEILHRYLPKAGQAGGQLGLEKMGIKLNFNLKNEKLVKELKKRGTKITGEITKKTINDLRDVLVREFYNKGTSIPKVARMIDGMFEETYKGRAETIARTETGIAQEVVAHETYTRNGVEKKQWQAFLDEKTRDGHKEADGQVKNIDEPFEVMNEEGEIEELDHPLDPTASASNVINCRCNELPIVEDVPSEAETWRGE
jgi:PBSX family phage portal protein